MKTLSNGKESNLSPDHKIPLCACSERQTRYLWRNICAYISAQMSVVGLIKDTKLIAFLCIRSFSCLCLSPLYLSPSTPVQSLVSQLRIYSFYIPILPVLSLIYIPDESSPTRIPLFFPVTLLLLFSCPAPLQFLQPLLHFLS